MRKVMKETEVFTFDEVKDKALDKNRYINVEGIDWWEFIIEDWTEKLAEKGFEDAEIHFRGFYSQGDEAVFDCKNFDIKKLLNLVEIPEKRKKIILECDEKYCIGFEIYRKSFANLYYHENTRCLGWYTSINLPPEYEDFIEEFVTKLEEIRVELCEEIYSDLEDEYNYLLSDEKVEDTLKANEYEFLADGTIYC